MHYDFDTIYLEAENEAFTLGKKRFYDNKVLFVSGNEDGDKFSVKAAIAGKRGEYSIEILFDGTGGLYDYKCACEEFLDKSRPCKHIIAAALAFEDKYPHKVQVKGMSSDKQTDAIALSLGREYQKRRHTRYRLNGHDKLKLEPQLKLKDDKLCLKVSVGRSKMYVIKDISDFVSAVNSAGHRRYGVDLEFDHNIENFTQEAARLVDFITASYAEKANYFAAPTALPSKVTRDELVLGASDIDEIFDMYEGRAVRFDDELSSGAVRLFIKGENNIDATIKAECAAGGFVFSSSLPQFNFISGKKYCYIITDIKVHRISKDFAHITMPLLKNLNRLKKMFVSEHDMPFFYNSVLACVQSLLSVDAGAFDITVFEAAAYNAKVYISVKAGGGLDAGVSVNYDEESVDIFDDNYITSFVRDWEAERGLKETLGKYFPYYPSLSLDNEHDIYVLLKEGTSELFNYADVFLEESVQKMKIKKPPRIRVGVKVESDLLKIDMQSDEYTSEQLKEIIDAYREKKNYVRLGDGSFVDLDDVSIRSLSEILDVAGGFDENFSLPLYYAPYLSGALDDGFFELDRAKEFKELISSLKNVRDADIVVPQSLKSTMRLYQKEGFRWLKTITRYGFGGILADDMGLGKSLQIISLLLSQKGEGPSVIVCPTTLVLNWVNEFNKFAPQMKIMAVSGAYDARKSKVDYADSYDVIITSYELLRRDIDLYTDINFNFAVLDEAQYIKNPETKNSIAVKRLKSVHRFALTGTPIENSLSELWSIFDFVMPGYLHSYQKFRDKFESEIVRGSSTSATKLKKLTAPFILRRLKSEVLTELPPKVETNIEAALEGEQQKLYLANLNSIKENIKSQGEKINNVVALSMLTKLRQICCEPTLAYPGYEGNSAKLDTCLELLDEAVEGGHKILLFSQFTSMLDVIMTRLAEKGISYLVLRGDTPKSERMRLVTRFNKGETQVFLISLRAGGTGLNLTGADIVIHYDPWWNESVMNQATDRAYRIGQDKSVQVYKLILKDTIEEKIMALQKKKAHLSDMIVGQSQQNAILTGKLSYKDILNILEEPVRK